MKTPMTDDRLTELEEWAGAHNQPGFAEVRELIAEIKRLRLASAAAILASEKGSASDAIQDMLMILDPEGCGG